MKKSELRECIKQIIKEELSTKKYLKESRDPKEVEAELDRVNKELYDLNNRRIELEHELSIINGQDIRWYEGEARDTLYATKVLYNGLDDEPDVTGISYEDRGGMVYPSIDVAKEITLDVLRDKEEYSELKPGRHAEDYTIEVFPVRTADLPPKVLEDSCFNPDGSDMF